MTDKKLSANIEKLEEVMKIVKLVMNAELDKHGLENMNWFLLFHSEHDLIANGTGCIACAVMAYDEWLKRAIEDGQIKHDIQEDSSERIH
jgi:hypothetical protein